jgi:hypothetical protein
MARQTLPTRALLACGAVAGPVYVTVTMIQALTREGFDLRQHRFSWLTTGDLGWIHQSNMLLVGVLTVLFAVGMRQMVRTSRGAFAAEGRRGWAWLCGAAIPMVFAALTLVGFAIGGNPVAVAFLATPWIWLTALAVHLYRLEATRRDHVPAGRDSSAVGRRWAT